jgi:Xaa-Pro aminopeptidase
MPVPREEFYERIERTRKRMKDQGLDALIAYADNKITGNVRYLSNYSPRFGGYASVGPSEWIIFGKAVVVVPINGEPTLITDCGFAQKAVKEVAVLENVVFSMNFAKTIADLLKENAKDKVGICTWDRFPHSIYISLKEHFSKMELVPSYILEELRMVKSSAEIDIMKKGAKVLDEGMGVLIKNLEEGRTEKEVLMAAESFMQIANPSILHVYPTHIIAFGVRTAYGAPLETQNRLKKGDLVMMDICAEYDGYAADITRMKVFGKPTKQQKELYEINMEMQKKAIAAIRPGAKAREVGDAAIKVAEEYGYGKYVRPCVSHGIGLDVHEIPDVGVDETRLAPNMVITCEPALSLENLGSSIEDMVLVTEAGRELLTKYEKTLEI